MTKTAIMVDGGFYRKRALRLWGKKKPQERADELYEYVFAHLDKQDGEQERALYRVFYYDCRPVDKMVYHPLQKKDVPFGSHETYEWTNAFFDALMRKRKFALRFGRLSDNDLGYRIKPKRLNALLRGDIKVKNLDNRDFELSSKQKGVDMRLGLDISSLAYESIVDQIILIAGDSDFVPAAKVARRKGIDFILDPMGNDINDDLLEHIDGMESFIGCDPMKRKDD